MSVPKISLAYLSLYSTGELPMESFYSDVKIKRIAEELFQAFKIWGFVYLVDHGINEQVINDAYEVSAQFFSSEPEKKEKFLRRAHEKEYLGFSPINTETFEKSRPYDIKESFDFGLILSNNININENYPGFVSAQTKLYNSSQNLTKELLRLLNFALPTSDPEFLLKQHKHLGDMEGNVTISRLLCYPAIKSSSDVLENQLRCGEHSDYGTITLLFQDQQGGLQVVNPQGEYVDVTPIPGSIVVNAGDLLEVWSSGQLKSTKHRVVIPTSKESSARYSMVFFVHPDSDVMISCLDGSDKYKSVNSLDYLDQQFKETYG